MSDAVYIHGTSEEEQRRLSLMNDVLLNPASIRKMALRGDETILDLGAGLGQFTRAMARSVPLRPIAKAMASSFAPATFSICD
ncbi:MAG TPA: hypothetical protein VIO12_03935 [Thermoanaerobaculia bacterium]